MRLIFTLSEYLGHLRRLLRVTSACDGPDIFEAATVR